MEPTADELSRITDLDGALQWAGVDGPFKQALLEGLGKPQLVRDIVYIPKDMWKAATDNIKYAPVPGQNAVDLPLSVGEVARVAAFRCCFRLPIPNYGGH